MGIHKLTSFVRKANCSKLLYLTRGSKIVIDGFGLCYKLHCGILSGDYCQFYDKVVTYLSSLTKDGLEVYVVIDGVDYDNKKVETDRHRDVKRLHRLWKVNSDLEEISSPFEITISYMAKIVFTDAVRNSGVQYFVADGEADRDVVSLANHLCCPVFGTDSDYFVFNIEGGFIPMDDGSGGFVDLNNAVRCFDFHLFDSAYNLRGDYPRLPIAYCIGNDFHDSHTLPELGIEKCSSVETVVSKLCGQSFDNYEAKFPDDFSFYHVDSRSFEDLSRSLFLCEFNPSVPDWVVSEFKKGLFSAISMRFLACKVTKTWKYTIAIEDLSRESACKVTNEVFPYIAGALLSCEGNKPFVRVCRKTASCDFEKETILLSKKHANILDLHNLGELSPIERGNILLRVFHCKSVCKMLQKVPDVLKLAVIASRCWLRSIQEDVNHNFNAFIVALVFCLKKCFHRSRDHSVDLTNNRMGRLRRIHHLAQWEYMFHLVVIFNQILGSPFPYTSLGFLFSTTVFNGYFTSKPDLLISKLDPEGKFMYEAIAKNLLPDVPVQPARRVAAPCAPTPANITTANRFGSLPEC